LKGVSILLLPVHNIVVGCIVVFAMLFNSCSMLSTVSSFSALSSVFSFVAIFALCTLRGGERSRSMALIVLILIVGGILGSSLVNLDLSNLNTGASQILAIGFGYLCAEKIPYRIFAGCFLRIMALMSTASIFLWFWVNVLDQSFPSIALENVNGVHYETIIIASLFDEPYITSHASMGIFWEPGVFASFIIVALLLELHFEEKTSLARVGAFIVALLTTESTAGILLVPIVFASVLMERCVKYRLPVFLMLLIGSITLVFLSSPILRFLASINPDMFLKLVEDNAVTANTRIQSPFICLSIFSSGPIFGYGYSGALDLYQSTIAYQGDVDSLTSTSFFLLSAYGLTGIILVLLPLLSVANISKKSAYSKILILIIIVAILNKEPHMTTCFLYALAFYPLFENNLNDTTASLIEGNAGTETRASKC
jgi:hypothetical protein